MNQPAPFILQVMDDGAMVASNGIMCVIAPDAGSRMFLRRGVRAMQAAPLAEALLPQINQLAGDLLSQSNMSADEIRARLQILMSACVLPEQENLECCVAELDGVRAYVQDGRVILTRQDITV